MEPGKKPGQEQSKHELHWAPSVHSTPVIQGIPVPTVIPATPVIPVTTVIPVTPVIPVIPSPSGQVNPVSQVESTASGHLNAENPTVSIVSKPQVNTEVPTKPSDSKQQVNPEVPAETVVSVQKVSSEVPAEPAVSKQQVNPEVTTKPSDSKQQVNPEVPAEPAVSKQQVNPEVPTKPSDSKQQVNPEVPAEPAVSKQQVNPEVPTKPSDSKQQVNPEVPAEPAVSKQQVNPEVPTKPSDSKQQINPEVPAEPVVSKQQVNPEGPAETVVSIQKVNSEVPAEPAVSKQQLNPEVPAETVVSVQQVSPEVPAETVVSVQQVSPEVPAETVVSVQQVSPDVPTASGQLNPGQLNPGQLNPGQLNPGQLNPGQLNPGQLNPGQLNPGQLNPGQLNPGQLNTTVSVPANPEGQIESTVPEPVVSKNQLEPTSSKQEQPLPTDGNTSHDNKPWELDQNIPRWPEELNIPGQGQAIVGTEQGITFSGEGNLYFDDQRWYLEPLIPYWPPEFNFPGQGEGMAESSNKMGGQGNPNLPAGGNSSFEGEEWRLEKGTQYWPPELNYPGQGQALGEGGMNPQTGPSGSNMPGGGSNSFEGEEWRLEKGTQYWPPELNYPGQGQALGEGGMNPQMSSLSGPQQSNMLEGGSNSFEDERWRLEPLTQYWYPELNYPGQGQGMMNGQQAGRSVGPAGPSNMPDGGSNSFEDERWRLEPLTQYWYPELNYPGQGLELLDGQRNFVPGPTITGQVQPNISQDGNNLFEDERWRLEPNLPYMSEAPLENQGQGIPGNQMPVNMPQDGSNMFEDEKWKLEPNLPYMSEAPLENQGQGIPGNQMPVNIPQDGNNMFEDEKWKLEPNLPYMSEAPLPNQGQVINGNQMPGNQMCGNQMPVTAGNFAADGSNLHEEECWQLEQYPPYWPQDSNIPGQSTGKCYPPSQAPGSSTQKMQLSTIQEEPQQEYPPGNEQRAFLNGNFPDGGSNAYEDQPWRLEKVFGGEENENGNFVNYNTQDQNCDPSLDMPAGQSAFSLNGSQQGNPFLEENKCGQPGQGMSFTESALALIDTLTFQDNTPCNQCDIPQSDDGDDIWSWIYSTITDIIGEFKSLGPGPCNCSGKSEAAKSAGDQSGNNNAPPNPPAP